MFPGMNPGGSFISQPKSKLVVYKSHIKHRKKRYQKRARVSVYRYKTYNNRSSSEAWQCSKEFVFDKYSFSTLPSLNSDTDFHDSHVKVFDVIWELAF